jgi:serine/threonine-protein kinase
MPLRIGQSFAGYTIVRQIGAGGMGEVYLARHPRLPREEALKVLRPDVSGDPGFRDRFIREADLAAALSHPHIVAIHDRGDDAGQLWIAMDYIEGVDAAKLLAATPDGMPAEKVLTIVTAMADALDYAHSRGVLHRDVKPANILCGEQKSGSERYYLTDFGIARDIDESGGLTATNMTVGTWAYSPPEQLMGEKLDGTTDQYALGASAFHLLAGAQPFPSSNPAVVITHHLHADRPKLSALHPELARFDDVLARAMAKDKKDRYPSCVEFARALQRAAGQDAYPAAAPTMAASAIAGTQSTADNADAAQSVTADERPRPPASRRWLYIAAAVAAVSVPAALAVSLHSRTDTKPDAATPVSAKQTADRAAEAAASWSTAREAAEAIKSSIPEITELAALNEDNDSNGLLGRPNGYTAAVVLIDKRSKGLCDHAEPGVDCGATIEQWPDRAAAERRADYLQKIHAAAPVLGTEWTTVNGDLLLRVTGELTPTAAKAYEQAFTE